MSECYKLNDEDLDVLEAVKLLLRTLVDSRVIRPAQLVSVAKLLHALSMLPQTCDHVSVTVSIGTRIKYQESSGSSDW
jgi:hypothetical protein